MGKDERRREKQREGRWGGEGRGGRGEEGKGRRVEGKYCLDAELFLGKNFKKLTGVLFLPQTSKSPCPSRPSLTLTPSPRGQAVREALGCFLWSQKPRNKPHSWDWLIPSPRPEASLCSFWQSLFFYEVCSCLNSNTPPNSAPGLSSHCWGWRRGSFLASYAPRGDGNQHQSINNVVRPFLTSCWERSLPGKSPWEILGSNASSATTSCILCLSSQQTKMSFSFNALLPSPASTSFPNAGASKNNPDAELEI